MKTALILYSSTTGNTEKVAQAIRLGLEEAGVKVTAKKPEAAAEEDYFSYDLVCLGAPSIQWHIPRSIDDFLKKNLTGTANKAESSPPHLKFQANTPSYSSLIADPTRA
jgi:flavodoxin